MRILGIDPGYDRLGIAIMERTNGKEVLLHSECAQTDASLTFEARIKAQGDVVEALIAAYHPDAVALERLFFSKNQRTAMRVAETRGALLLIAERHTLKIFEYTPQEVKVAMTGYGKSGKREVARMVQRLIPGTRAGALDDEYDAIAVAATCLACAR